ncbi:hypothetical protein [Sphingomonas bacterium]|uniref:hypothetical protein n=1 Tax=Sphingomonas bacterium TaxID=1895847 RepID=UPI0015757F66|nr:hypothetical protein [Sphingomonas bacterium]
MTAANLRRLRQLHLYFAVFFAPAIVFFSFSGVLQTYGFHEARGGRGEPPAWIKIIASLHQHQRLHRPERPRPAGPALTAAGDHDHPRGGGGGDDHARPPGGGNGIGLIGLKLFTGLMGVGLIVASLLGIVIALATRSTRRVSVVMLVLGTLLPVALILV